MSDLLQPGGLPLASQRLEHGWLDDDGNYICDGCNVLGSHEHRCHGADGDRECDCPICAAPTPEELARFERGMNESGWA